MEETKHKKNSSIDDIKENNDIPQNFIKKSEKDIEKRFENNVNVEIRDIDQNEKDFYDFEKKIYIVKRNGIYLFFLSSFQLFLYYGYKGRFGIKISEILKKIKNFCSRIIYSEILTIDYKYLKKVFFVSLGIGLSTFFLGSKFQKLFQEFKHHSTVRKESINKQSLHNQFEFNISNSYNKNNVILTEDKLFQSPHVQTTVFDNETDLKDNLNFNINTKIKNKRKNFSFSYNNKKIRELKSKLYRKHFYNKKNEIYLINTNVTEHTKSNSKNNLYDNDSNKEINYNNSNHNLRNFSRSITQFTNTNFSKKEFQTDDSDDSNFYYRKRDTDYSNIYHKKRDSENIKIKNDTNRFQQQILSFKTLHLNKSFNPDVSVLEKSHIYSNKSPVKQINAFDESNSKSNIYKFTKQNSFSLIRKFSENDKEMNSNEEIKIEINDHVICNKTFEIKEKSFLDDKIFGNDKKYVEFISPRIEIEKIAFDKKEQVIPKDIFSGVLYKEIGVKKNLSGRLVKNSKSKVLFDIKKNNRNSKIVLMQYTKPKF